MSIESELPGCIRREIAKIRAENVKLGIGDYPLSDISMAFSRWAKRRTNSDIAQAIFTVMNHCIKPDTCLYAKLMEAARRLRLMDKNPNA